MLVLFSTLGGAVDGLLRAQLVAGDAVVVESVRHFHDGIDMELRGMYRRCKGRLQGWTGEVSKGPEGSGDLYRVEKFAGQAKLIY